MMDYRFRGETQVLDAAARASASGSFVELADGITHYELAGPAQGQPVVLVHGFSVPYYIWDPTFAALAEAGFRVLRYDLFGRGYSGRPEAVYNQDLFDRQLLDLLSSLVIEKPVNLVGLSMGGLVVINFADRHPALARKLCLVDPAGFPLRKPFYAGLIRAPFLGELMLDRLGDRLLVQSDFYRPARFPGFADRYRPQMKYIGFKRSLLSTIRNMELEGGEGAYRRVGRQKQPVLLIWGREDGTIPFPTSERVKAAIPHLEFQAIDEAGHLPHYEQPQVVNPLLVRFLRSG